jgi:hypothetical protein
MDARWFRLFVCAMVVVGLAGPVAGAATAGAGARRADLVVSSLAAPGTAMAGGEVTLRVKVRNHGSRPAAATRTSYSLSTDAEAGGDQALGTVRTPALRPGKKWTGRLTGAVPATTAPGTYRVIACADAGSKVREEREDDNCRASGPLTVSATASSHDLVDEDVAAGVITEEQGLIYKVFSDFGDERLPERYVGVPDGLGHGALAEAAEAWESLTATGKETLRPFLIPPYYEGSHWNPAEPGRSHRPPPPQQLEAPWCSGGSVIRPVFHSWEFLDTPDGSFRIWWLKKHPGDRALATRLSTVLATVLPALETLMGHSYKSDGGGSCDGESAAVDIALVDTDTATVTPNDTACGQAGSSARMMWPRTKPPAWPDIDPYLAHEVMHLIQLAMPVAGRCDDYGWLREMTAEWVQDYVTDPLYGIGLGPDDTEHLAADDYLDLPNVSLDAPGDHAYGTYLLAQWQVRQSSPAFVRDIWLAAAANNATGAVDAALPNDGFESTWADFALSNWNRKPYAHYLAWDQMPFGAAYVGKEPVMPTGSRMPTVKVNHLAAQYLELDIDPTVDELEVANDKAGDPNAELQAVVTYDDGTTKHIDLSADPTTVICIDDGTKRATQVVLIFSNSHQTDDTEFKPKLTGAVQCGCPNSTTQPRARAEAAVCEGNITFSWTHETVRPGPDGSQLRTEESGEGILGLGLVPDPEDPDIWSNDPASTYSVSSDWHFEYDGPCAEVADSSHVGEGMLGEGATFATRAPDSDELWVSNSVLMETEWIYHSEDCGGPSDESGTRHLVTPECPPTPQGGNIFWEFEPVAPGSDTYTYDCTGTVEYADGSGEHTVTHTVSGTITLP